MVLLSVEAVVAAPEKVYRVRFLPQRILLCCASGFRTLVQARQTLQTQAFSLCPLPQTKKTPQCAGSFKILTILNFRLAFLPD